ncbi:MAG: helix-turn-helix domain-containing protein [Burkholderiales bacterium]
MRYQPASAYSLDLEVMSIAALRSRGSEEHFRLPQRVEFHLAFGVTAGTCRHMVDFVPHACRPRTWIFVKPGQIQRFDFSRRWAGWLLVFRREFLLPPGGTAVLSELSMASVAEAMPDRLDLPATAHAAAIGVVAQMEIDARMRASDPQRNALLRHQLYAWLLRLSLSQPGQEQSPASSQHLQRFRRFRHAVEEGFRTTHQVSAYAERLGCSERSLARAARQITGTSAKTYLAQRIALEAKRLLVHTTRPVKAIADELGFDEPTNFVKFFRREAGCSPGEFRRRNSGRQDAPARPHPAPG